MHKPAKCLLRNLLRSHNMRQVDLATKTGIRKQQISEYVNNRRTMTLQNAVTIADCLNVNVRDLYEWEND